MSAPSRCHECKHRYGPRALGIRRTPRKGVAGTQKKKSCACACHE